MALRRDDFAERKVLARMRNLSCDFARLYAADGIEAAQAREGVSEPLRPFGRWLCETYEPYAYERPLPRLSCASGTDAEHRVTERYREWNARYDRGVPSAAFAMENVLLYDRSLYGYDERGLYELYETNRPQDRRWKRELEPAMLDNVLRPQDRDAEYFYLGSTGSENYAHWLVDDLPRLKAVVADLSAASRLVVAVDGYFPQIDEQRVESIREVAGREVRVTVLDRRRPYVFERLHYVSPASYHPFMKSPQAMAFLYERLGVRGRGPKRLFVGRRAMWRNLLDRNRVAEFFSNLGFTIATIDFDSHGFAEQIALFGSAEVVVGVAGASMANTIFTPPGARVIALAPEGFDDPFYWDLAAAKGHEYAACFGTPWNARAPELSSFDVGREQLETIAGWI